MRLGQFALMSALALAHTSKADAQNTDTAMRDNVRCVVATGLLLKTLTDPQSQEVLNMALIYYVGRIDSLNPAFALDAAMKQEAAYVATVGANKEFERCIDVLNARMKTLGLS